MYVVYMGEDKEKNRGDKEEEENSRGKKEIKEGLRKPEGREIWAMSTANRILLWKTNY